jgi:hypothetical protein
MTMSYKMKIFGLVMIAHWLEHIFQAYQVYVLHMNRECALGMLGMKYPWLIRTESLHFGFAVLTTVGIVWAGWQYFDAPWAMKAWAIGFLASVWHLFEHLLLFIQAVSHHYFFGATQPMSLIQLIVPRIELHLFYNSVVTILLLLALLEEDSFRNIKEFQRTHKEEECTFCVDNHHNSR